MFNLRQGEAEIDRLSEDGSDVSALSGDTKISMNVQQINSRYHTVQSTVKVIAKSELLFTNYNNLGNSEKM